MDEQGENEGRLKRMGTKTELMQTMRGRKSKTDNRIYII